MLTKNDKKEIVLLTSEAIEQLVLPRFDELRNEIKSDIQDVQLTVNRFETLQKHELDRADDHEVRLGKLEQAHAK